MTYPHNPEPAGQEPDTLGGPDPGEREDELAGPGTGEPGTAGPDTLGGPDPGEEDELR